jgi:glyoxylase I family protein
MTHDDGPTEAFDERRVGLDHLSFGVTDRSELERWVAHLDAYSVVHSGIIDYHYGPTVVMRDPDNIQLELFVHPAPDHADDLLAHDPARATTDDR